MAGKIRQVIDEEINVAVAKKLDAVPGHNYVGDIKAAWEIVEKLIADNYDVNLMVRPYPGDKEDISCHAQFIRHGGFRGDQGWDKEMPMAICKAFLKLGDK